MISKYAYNKWELWQTFKMLVEENTDLIDPDLYITDSICRYCGNDLTVIDHDYLCPFVVLPLSETSRLDRDK